MSPEIASMQYGLPFYLNLEHIGIKSRVRYIIRSDRYLPFYIYRRIGYIRLESSNYFNFFRLM